MWTAAIGGAVYQNTSGDLHIRSYTNSLNSLYSGLNEEGAGGQGHGARLARMGIQAIRVYELPADNEDDARRTKEIFRRLFTKYQIKVLIGDWAGLHSGKDFRNPRDVTQIRSHLQRLIATYAEEPWVLGWQIGNENNYHVRNGVLGQEINLDAAEYYSLMDNFAGAVKEQLGRRKLTQFVSLGQGDLTKTEADLIGAMKNIDAVGINCYREDPNGFEEVISLAASQTKLPIYFAEVGRPSDSQQNQEQQARYLWHVCSLTFSHGAGRVRSGIVIGVFVHETTDEAWKRYERGREGDAHYGVLGKSAEAALGLFLTQNRDFSALALPKDDSPDSLINSAWQCVEGPYARKYSREYGYAMAYANRAITLYQDEARKQQAELVSFKSPPDVAANPRFWALNSCYLLDEEDSDEAKSACEHWGVIHFSRKGNPAYNQPSGKFQARTKGGNLNSWLYEHGKKYEFVTFLDPDHAPRPEFLDKVLGYFENPKVAFVQAPQVFHNRSANWIARGAAEQSYFFYGPIQMGLFSIGACVVNGSHSTFRVSDLFALKGESYAVHDADDILTSMRIHSNRKVGVYVPEVLAEGLAPDTWEEFSKQQRRRAYSMFHLFFYFYRPELWRMPWRCKLVYLVLTSFYFRGVAFAGLLVLPFVSAITGNPPVNARSPGVAGTLRDLRIGNPRYSRLETCATSAVAGQD